MTHADPPDPPTDHRTPALTVTTTEQPFSIHAILEEKGYSATDISAALRSQILLIPDDLRGRLAAHPARELLRPEAVDLPKRFRARGLQANLVRDKRVEHQYAELRSADLIIDTVVIIANGVTTVALNLLSNYKGSALVGPSRLHASRPYEFTSI